MGAWAVVAFDMDGTLIRGTTACLHLAGWIGHTEVIGDLERRYIAGEIDNAAVADGDAIHYAGLTIEDIAVRMGSVPCIDGIEQGIRLLDERGVVPVIATVSWDFAARCLADRYGFAAVSGVQMEQRGGRLTGRVAAHFERADKVAFVREVCARHGVTMDSVVAIGDGHSDLPLFEAAGFSVALNASEAARRAATVAVDSDTLLDALRAVPNLID